MNREAMIESLRRCSACGHTRDRHEDGGACKHRPEPPAEPCACAAFVPGRLSAEGLRALHRREDVTGCVEDAVTDPEQKKRVSLDDITIGRLVGYSVMHEDAIDDDDGSLVVHLDVATTHRGVAAIANALMEIAEEREQQRAIAMARHWPEDEP